jgi:hypothetical protein
MSRGTPFAPYAAVVAVTASAIAALLLVGPHHALGSSYAPNFISSLVEVTVGAAAIAAFLDWKRRKELAPVRLRALLKTRDLLNQLVTLVQAAYVESSLENSSPPSHLDALLVEWEVAFQRLRLDVPPQGISNPGNDWRWFLSDQASAIRRQADGVLDRFGHAIPVELHDALTQLASAEIFALLEEIPEIDRNIVQGGGPPIERLYLYFSLSRATAIPTMRQCLDDFKRDTLNAVNVYNRLDRLDEPVVVYQVLYDPARAAWAKSRLA